MCSYLVPGIRRLRSAEYEKTVATAPVGAGTTAATKAHVEYMRGPDMGGGVGGLLATFRNPVNTTNAVVTATVTNPIVARHNLSNGRGDIVAQSDASATLTWTASYEAYGKRTKETGQNKDKQRANTKDEDPTGLLNEGHRYRDIETGGWLSRDPAGFVDGPNLYAYVKQNPWTCWDPDGLQSYHWYQGGFLREHMFDPVYNTVTNHAGNNTKTSIAGGLSGVVRGGMDVANMAMNGGMPQTGFNKRMFEAAKQFVSDSSASLFGVDGNSQAFTDSQTTGEIFSPVPGGAVTKGTRVLKNIAKAESKAMTNLVKTALNTVDEAKALVDNMAPQMPTIACFTAGTLVATGDGPLKIETLQVGDRVLTTDDENQRHETEVDPQTWKKVTLAMINEECRWDILELEVIRSPEWMQQTECREGGRIWFVLDEIGLEGWATVKHIAPCPVVKPGLGRVVLSTLTHYNGDVYDLHLVGSSEVLEPTGRHRLFSATRNDWVRTETLSEGEQLKTRDGVRTIASIGHRAGIHRVYNIEVETEHCYYVGPQQVLSHNQNGCAVIAETNAGKGNITSKTTLTADEALTAGEKFVGTGYSEIGKAGSGVFRSKDGLRQFRMDNNSLAGNHPPNVPHVHFEIYPKPNTPKPRVNNHVPFKN